jgi:hypothetical protein
VTWARFESVNVPEYRYTSVAASLEDAAADQPVGA